MTKPLDQFHKDKSRPDGRTSKCASCRTAKTADWRADNPVSKERQKVIQQKSYKKHKAKRNAESAAYQKTHKGGTTRWRDKNPEKVRASALKKYGLTVEDYANLKNFQNGTCAICHKPETRRNTRTNKLWELAVDHCHDTLEVRGILCSACNRGIGFFAHDPALLASAIFYINNPTAKSVLPNKIVPFRKAA